MTSKIGYSVFAVSLCLLFVIATEAINVNITSKWKPELGWEVTCFWETFPNDTLQSVRLQKNGQQFMIYRPEIHGEFKSEIFRTLEHMLTVTCSLTATKGRNGNCVLTVEPYLPPTSDLTYECEVSGERPTFMIGRKEYVVKMIVPPTDALLDFKKKEDVTPDRVMLNCSSSGLPAPSLQWFVAGDKVQADFTGRLWNATSKLWHVWSFLAYNRSSQSSAVMCMPEVHSNNETLKGKPAMYSSASSLGVTKIVITFLLSLELLR